MKGSKRNAVFIAVLAAVVSSAYAGGAKDAGSPSGKPVKIYAAHTQTYVPYDFVNEKGESDGFEVAVLKAVDELLPEYEFKFVPTSDDDLLIGVESGKYQVGTKGAWVTEERKNKFLFPQNPIAASVIGITFRSADADKIRDFESFARFSGKLVPIAPQSAQFAVVQEYNKAHPEKPVKLEPADTFVINDAYAWVLEGRYDAFFDIKLSYENNVADGKGPYHSLAGKLSYAPYKGIPTWPLFNKSNQPLADAYDRAIKTLKENGTLSSLSLKYFGEDVFVYVTQ
ncbi:transporter substrate-binding domain-containing protein [Treponema zuelzerae]|uniref:Transporter substrate-binding domain-containing protein n=1 Tax=Teretinema zuelzerae TaxID=156 RepID=A0AAE3EKG7_9SPIR|nr:transporter substrate-binding domain-containing protein [Teretinema zuelzerae]MCD1655536.1 transporter substrate-binding domain-containing protein [Teretinema zuelzerae]